MIRVVNRLLAFLFGAALTAGGGLVVIEAIWTWTNSGFVWIPGDQWLSTFESTPWSGPIVLAASAGVAALGLLLVLFEVWPHRPRFVPYDAAEGSGQWLLLRRSTEGHIARRIARQIPVKSVRARIKPRPLAWTLIVTAAAAPSSAPLLEAEARSRLDELHAPQSSRVRVATTGVAADPTGSKLPANGDGR